MYTHSSQSGYSLIEVLIAVSILMIAIVAPMTIAVKSLQSSQYSMEQNTAVFLAQEGISLVETNRNQAALQSFNDPANEDFWGWTQVFVDAGCSTATACNFDAHDPYNLNVVACEGEGENCTLYYDEDWGRSAYRVGDAGGGAETQFIRRIYIDELSTSLIRVRSEVEWGSNFLGQDQKVSLTATYYNVYGAF